MYQLVCSFRLDEHAYTRNLISRTDNRTESDTTRIVEIEHINPALRTQIGDDHFKFDLRIILPILPLKKPPSDQSNSSFSLTLEKVKSSPKCS